MDSRKADAEEDADPKLKKDTTHSSRDRYVTLPLGSVLFFLAATLTVAIIVELLPTARRNWKDNVVFSSSEVADAGPTFAIYGKSRTEEHLVHVLNVLRRFGYQRTSIENDWNLLWAHDYPFFDMAHRLKNMQAHQMVNHMPGCGFLTNKVDLSTTKLPFLPAAFRLPAQRAEFLSYAGQNSNALFVQKHNEHRHIVITPTSKVNLSSSESFVQEFVQNPFLVDGHKFDIGVYVVITSVDPLRIYLYTGDVLFRFCPAKYHPFDPTNLDKYVVGDDYLPIWEVPSLIKYYQQFGGSMRGAFDAYIIHQALKPTVIWTQVEDIIRSTILAKEPDIVGILRAYKTRNFFDLMRFDLIIDDQLRVHLMEANMSPNLSSAHFKPNSLLYEQILYSALNLVGVGSPVHWLPKERSSELREMVTADKSLASNLNDCVKNSCDTSCNKDECFLCLPCISGSEYTILEKAHREHLHRIDMKRIFPKPIHDRENFDVEVEVLNMTKRNEWMTRWFFYKCNFDSSWCS